VRRAVVSWAALATAPLAARAGGEAATALRHRVDTSHLSSTDLLLATLYNDHRLLYAVLTTVSMAVLGLAVGYTVEVVLGQLGLRASRAARRE